MLDDAEPRPRGRRPARGRPAPATPEAEPSADGKDGVKSLANGLRLLDLVTQSEHPLSIAEAASRLGLSRPAVYRLVRTLTEHGYLTQDPHNQRLSIGLDVLRPAGRVLDRNRLRLEAIPNMQDLARRVGERVNLGMLHRGQILLIAGIEKPGLPTIFSRFGNVTPAHSGGLGKAVLAWLPEAEVQAIAQAHPLVARTPNTITSLTALLKDLEETRRRGYSIDRGENTAGSMCIAAPVLDINNRPLAAVSISGRDIELLLGNVEHLLATVERIAHVSHPPI